MQATLCCSGGQLASRCVGPLRGSLRRGSGAAGAHSTPSSTMQVLLLRGEPASGGRLQQRAATQRQGAATGAWRLGDSDGRQRAGALWLAPARAAASGGAGHPLLCVCYHLTCLPADRPAAWARAHRWWRPRASSACGRAETRAWRSRCSSRWWARAGAASGTCHGCCRRCAVPLLCRLALDAGAAAPARRFWAGALPLPACLPRSPCGILGARRLLPLSARPGPGCRRCRPRRRWTPRTRSLSSLCAPPRRGLVLETAGLGRCCADERALQRAVPQRRPACVAPPC